MTQVSQPRTTVAILAGTPDIENTPQKLLYVGEVGFASGGPIPAGALVENIQIGQEDALFEPQSMLAHMIRDGRRVNKVTQFDAIALPDSDTGTAAESTTTFTGPATENGQLEFIIGSEEEYTFTVTIAEGDTETDIAATLEALIDASDAPILPTAVAGVVTNAAYHVGLLGNSFSIGYSGSVAGVTVNITEFTGGTGGPTLTGVFDVLGDKRYQGIVWPYAYDTDELVDFLQERFNVDNKVLDGVGITLGVDFFANHVAALDVLNAQTLVYFAEKKVDLTTYKGSAQAAFPWSGPSLFGATRALRLTEGASISDYVTATFGALDAFGGAALASKPYFNTPFDNLPLYPTGRGWDDQEIEQLHDEGGSVFGNNIAGNTVLSGEIVTTYKNDDAGNPDVSFKYLNYVDTASGAREYFSNNLRARFKQSRLTEGDVIGGRDQVNALTIEAFCVALYQDLSGADFVLLEAGEEALNFFKANLIVTIDKATGTATVNMIVPLVTQLRTINATMQIAFSTRG